MTIETLVVQGQTNTAKLQLFAARRALGHFVEMFDNREWRRFYKEDAFVAVVRQARHVVEHWTEIVSKSDLS
jgi:hypothetical protein